ncbi:NAD(P)/FAD-dependent oxidoreductase [Actinokineospora inagensis]|uniref:NAD(P)/FAD-dependent oxidoreductase n=1 Tax=Actinokineospora inagensis TaxID=103730 RepID=UPI000407914C|nr:FAD-binding oxidoreductase [Actinokineospora inagensis]
MERPNSAHTETPTQADVVIVGNGALGLFLAEELVGRNAGAVVVVGPSDRDAGASMAAGAMLGTFGEVTADSLRTHANRTRFEIGLRAHDLWPDVLSRLEEYSSTGFPLQTATESHVVLNAIGAELDTINLEAMIKALDEYGKPWSEIDPKDIPGFKPRTDTRALRAIHVPGEGAVDARGVLAALEARLDDIGATRVNQTVRRLVRDGDAVTGVELADGHVIEAGTVVVATGARSEALVRTAAEDIELIPMIAGLGFAMIAQRTSGEPFRSVVRTPNRGFACGLHVVPAGPGREYLGATNRLVDEVSSVTWVGDARYLAQYAMQQLDEQIARHEVVGWLSGNRPVTFDGFPMIGWLPLPGLYLMTGTYRDGFHCAPLLAAHVANELQGQPGLIDSMFNPVRRPIATRTVEESVEEYVTHSLAAWFETGAEAAPQMTTTQLAAYYRTRGREAFDQLGTDYAFGPDVLWYAEGSLVGARRIARYLNRLRGNASVLTSVGSGVGDPR